MSQNLRKGITGKHTRNGKPIGYSTITPFIVVSNPAEAIAFYQAVFGATVIDVTKLNDDHGNEMIVHAELDFGHGRLQLGAANPTYKLVPPPENDMACYSLGIYVEEVDLVFEKCIHHGAKVREQVMEFVSGDRYCSVLDPYGIRWSIMTRVEDLSDEESAKRVAEWAKSFQ